MSLKRAVCVLFLIPLLIGVSVGQEKKPRSEKEIREELDKAKQRVAELEKELASVAPMKVVDPQPFPDENFKVGETYNLYTAGGTAVKVLDVVDEKSVLVQIEIGRRAYPTKFLMMTPTKGMVDGQYFLDATNFFWTVTGTKKVGGTTVYVMEPVKPPVKK